MNELIEVYEMAKPFEGLFGDGSELRVIQFMLPSKGLEFNISELARGTGVSRQTLVRVVRKLLNWNVLMIASKHGNANYYALNEDSGFVEAFESLNNCIIEQILGAEELARIADYSMKHAHFADNAPNPPHSSYIVAECGETSPRGYLNFISKDRQEQPKLSEPLANSEIRINLGENYAVAA